MERHTKSYGSYQQYRPARRVQNSGLFSFFNKNKNLKKDTQGARQSILTTVPKPIYNNIKIKKKRRYVVAIILLVIIIIGWLSLMLYLPYYRVTKISIEGNQIAPSAMIESRIRSLIDHGKICPSNNYFVIRLGQIEKTLQTEYNFKSVNISKTFPDSIQIVIEERPQSIVYDNGRVTALLDMNGAVLKFFDEKNSNTSALASNYTTSSLAGGNASSTASLTGTTTSAINLANRAGIGAISSTSSSLTVAASNTPKISRNYVPNWHYLAKVSDNKPILYDERGLDIQNTSLNVAKNEVVNTVLKWSEVLNSEKIASVRYFIINNEAAGLEIIMDKPWILKVKISSDTNDQLINLKELITKSSIQPTEYIDLRFGERIFWK